MTADEPGGQLRAALLVLTAVARELQGEARHPLPAAPLNALQDCLRHLAQSQPARPLTCPEPCRQQWLRFRAHRRRHLEAHVIRHLCWDAEAATDSRFHEYLERQEVALGARSLEGLVRVCHACWSEELLTGPVGRAVWRRLARYEGANALLLRWQGALPLILGPQGPGELANALVQRLSPIKEWCAFWGVDERSAYVQEGVRRAVHACRRQMDQSARRPALAQYLVAELLPWDGWRWQDFLTEVAATLLHPLASSFWEPLTHFLLHDPRLGDPRLPGNEAHWVEIPEAARQRLLQWLGARVGRR
jgi:hypothetical protein